MVLFKWGFNWHTLRFAFDLIFLFETHAIVGLRQHVTLRNFKILRPLVRENSIGLCVKFLENIALFIRLIFASNETTPLMTKLKRFLGVSHLIVHFLVVV